MKLLPFDLAKAQAGHPIVYRNGEKPKEWHPFENCIVTINEYDVALKHIKSSGGLCTTAGESNYDLFLKSEQVTLWFVV